MITISHGDADVHGTDLALRSSILMLSTPASQEVISCHLGHDALTPAYIDPQHGLKFIVHVRGPPCWRDLVWRASAYFAQIVTGFHMHDEAFARGHVANDVVAG